VGAHPRSSRLGRHGGVLATDSVFAGTTSDRQVRGAGVPRVVMVRNG
jgi:hypothetical protein